MEMDTITLNIVVVSYNAQDFIQEAMKSIFMQRLCPNIKAKIIIADDCSSDNTISAIKEVEGISPWKIEFLDTPTNLGITENYRRVFSLCDADYLAVIEGDDIWSSPYHLQNHIDLLDTHREVSMSVNRYLPFVFHDDMNITEFYHLDSVPNDIRYFNLDDTLECNYVGNFSSCVFRGKSLSRIDSSIYSLNIENLDDWLVSIELSRHGLVAVMPEVTTLYRLHNNSFWSSIPTQKKDRSILNRYFEYHNYLGGKYRDKGNRELFLQNRKDSIPPIVNSIYSIPRIIKKWTRVAGGFFVSKNNKIRIKQKFGKQLS